MELRKTEIQIVLDGYKAFLLLLIECRSSHVNKYYWNNSAAESLRIRNSVIKMARPLELPMEFPKVSVIGKVIILN